MPVWLMTSLGCAWQPTHDLDLRSELTFSNDFAPTRDLDIRSGITFSNDSAHTSDLDLRFPILGGHLTLWYYVFQCFWASDALVCIFVMPNRSGHGKYDPRVVVT